MVNRTTFSGSSTPPLSGPDVLDQYAERLGTLFDASNLMLTAIGGTADAVTATLDPPLAVAGAFVDGMKFTLTWGATNTAGVTLAINGGAALPVVDARATALAAGSLESGLRSLIEYVGGSFRILSPILDAAGGSSSYISFTASGTFTKPSSLDDDRMITIEAWGAGAGGASAAGGPGGGGGGYKSLRVRAADVPSSVTVTIGAGGAVNAAGSSTTFGSLLTAYGGAPGANSPTGGGGGGGGELGAGSSGAASNGGIGGPISGGKGGNNAVDGSDGGLWGGGGGGGGGGNTNGGRSVNGGGGGANAGGGIGGQSLYGGSGGSNGVAGSAPGGGGGRNAAGARGEVRIWI